MTPKEKCDELIDKFVNASVVEEEENYFHPRPYSLAKQCALVFVKEMLNIFYVYDSVLNNTVNTELAVGFWLEVKKEIKNYENK